MVICFEGRMGQGKTLSASILAHYLNIRFEQLGMPKTLRANYSLSGSKRIKNLRDLRDIRNSIVVIDEAHNQWDSREFKNKENIKVMKEWLDYSRKFGNIVLITTQHFGKIDHRVRISVIVLGLPMKRGNSLKLRLCEMIETQKGVFLYRSKEYNTDNVKPFYELYDTCEVVDKLE